MRKKVLHILGKSRSGKTTLIEKLLAEFQKRGFKVSVLKHSHQEIELDKKGKDTFRFTESGAEMVGFLTARKTYLLKKREDKDFELLTDFLFFNSDLVLVEGHKQSSYPAIQMVKIGEKLFSQSLAVISSEKIDTELPVFHPGETRKLADFIVKKLKLKRRRK